MRTIIIAFALALVLLSFATAQPSKVYKLWTKAELFDLAASHASKYAATTDKTKVLGLRYFDLAAVPPKDRPAALSLLSYGLQSLSRADKFFNPTEVPGSEGALVWLDVTLLKIDPAQLDRLGQLGSGPVPFPEPYYHSVVVVNKQEEKVILQKEPVTTYEEVWVCTQQYGWVKERRKVASSRQVQKTSVETVKVNQIVPGAHLNKAGVIGLTALLKTDFPIFEYHWFLSNALIEPRYHEILGLDDSIKSVQKLAGVDEKLADEFGAQLRGAILVSGVAHRNRFIERTPLANIRYGRGVFISSFDFKTSINSQDVLKDPLNAKSDAREIIWNLPNGLLGFFVTDGVGKRLDVAAADVALNNSGKWQDRQVRTAVHCMDCHLREKGWIELDEEVRALAVKPVKLALENLVRAGKQDDATRFRQKYLDADFNEVLRVDQLVVDAAVKASTKRLDGGFLTSAETGSGIREVVRIYLESTVSLQQLALELGYPQDDVALALRTEGLDPVFAVLAADRKARRDQIEAGFAQIAAVLYLGSLK